MAIGNVDFLHAVEGEVVTGLQTTSCRATVKCDSFSVQPCVKIGSYCIAVHGIRLGSLRIASAHSGRKPE